VCCTHQIKLPNVLIATKRSWSLVATHKLGCNNDSVHGIIGLVSTKISIQVEGYMASISVLGILLLFSFVQHNFCVALIK